MSQESFFQNYLRKKKHLVLFVLCFSACYAQKVDVKVILNAKHSVGSISSFDRSKFITIHANQTENEWDGNNFTADLRNDFLNGYDVYLGRDTGGITWNVNQIQEDPNRTGYADPDEITTRGQIAKANFENNSHLHEYEHRKNKVIAAQLHPFWTGESQKPTGQGWEFASATATGEYMGRYLNEFHGGNGQGIPNWVEIINEPAYESLGGPNDYTHSLQEIADFHNEVAAAIRAQDPTLKIGGYTTAFPNFEKGNFQRWENRWKLFMDVAGDNMDFWSIHLYDFPSIHNGKKELRSGSNIEATFDMMEHYSLLSRGEIKPVVVSEYGAQMHDYAKDQWSPYRDWLHIKASNSQLMSFLERPNTIASAINFTIVKAEWGYSNGIPYNHRLMRKENEPDSYTGKWVYTDMIKFYDLWKNVNGTRVSSSSSDPDIQVDTYIEGKKVFLILNNLHFSPTEIDITLHDYYGTKVSSVLKKHLTLEGNTPVLNTEESSETVHSVSIGAESTMILEYTFEDDIVIDEATDEVKYYASSYLKDINANQDITFDIEGINRDEFGEAILRLGIGRDHGKNLQPSLSVNGIQVPVPSDWRGYDQAERQSFFGVLEIPVPFDILQQNNKIDLQFPDTGGKISSVSMQVFNFSKDFSTLSSDDIAYVNSKFTVYPNPTKEQFTCRVSAELVNAKLRLYNYTGQLVLEKEINSTTESFDTAHLNPGVYLLKCHFEGNRIIDRKILIQ